MKYKLLGLLPLFFTLVPLADVATDEAIAYANAQPQIEVIDHGIEDESLDLRVLQA